MPVHSRGGECITGGGQGAHPRRINSVLRHVGAVVSLPVEANREKMSMLDM